MSYGFHNRILRVDLSSRQVSVAQPGERFFRTYFGGWGACTVAVDQYDPDFHNLY